MRILEHFNLRPLTHFKIGGPARFFTEVKSEEELKEAVDFSEKKKIPFVALGAGSNVLVSDAGYPGLVIRVLALDIKIDGTHVHAGAGVPNAVLVAETVRAGLAGLEWAIGIPGSVGGSVRGNAGCFSGEMKDVVERVKFYNAKTKKFEEKDKKFCDFRYRESIFKTSPYLVITHIVLALHKGNPETSGRMVRHYSRERTDVQDIGSASAGCVFKNIPWPKGEAHRKRLLFLLPELAEFKDRLTIPVSFLIDHGAGLKGKKIGGVHISRKHANYFINNGHARAEEVIMLIGLVKEYVHRKFDLYLEEEIQYIGM
ncbi:MAG: UDP-N-acetylmuramate dehydrogenase [Candidatus Ryanbacteria bacterium]|nr:UDP-N-acetylmuramate dehydrogenase [Candidatus Ryanbacteria bacterium]